MLRCPRGKQPEEGGQAPRSRGHVWERAETGQRLTWARAPSPEPWSVCGAVTFPWGREVRAVAPSYAVSDPTGSELRRLGVASASTERALGLGIQALSHALGPPFAAAPPVRVWDTQHACWDLHRASPRLRCTRLPRNPGLRGDDVTGISPVTCSNLHLPWGPCEAPLQDLFPQREDGSVSICAPALRPRARGSRPPNNGGGAKAIGPNSKPRPHHTRLRPSDVGHPVEASLV